jgi:hypothetical protein
MDCIHLDQDSVEWQAVLKAVMNLWGSIHRETPLSN